MPSEFWNASVGELWLRLSKIRRHSRPRNQNRLWTLENDVSALQTRLLQANSVIEREQLLDKLVEYERRLGLAWTKGDAPNQRFPVQPASLTKVEDDLNPDDVFLEYVLDDPHSFCLSISRKGAYLRVLPVGRREIQKLTQQFVDEVRAKGAGINGAKQLYAWLLQPIPETAKANKLVIAPDGILNLLPFEALRDSQGEYLLKSHVISYVPSGTILDVLRRAKTQPSAPRPFLGVGDVAYENQGDAGRRMPAPDTTRGQILRGMADLSGIQLHDLPQTRDEVQGIGKIRGAGVGDLARQGRHRNCIQERTARSVSHLASGCARVRRHPVSRAISLWSWEKIRDLVTTVCCKCERS